MNEVDRSQSLLQDEVHRSQSLLQDVRAKISSIQLDCADIDTRLCGLASGPRKSGCAAASVSDTSYRGDNSSAVTAVASKSVSMRHYETTSRATSCLSNLPLDVKASICLMADDPQALCALSQVRQALRVFEQCVTATAQVALWHFSRIAVHAAWHVCNILHRHQCLRMTLSKTVIWLSCKSSSS
jgi:hypothetical protein